MSWIREIEESKAEGKLKDVYEDICEDRGKLSNIMKVHSLNPSAMSAHMDLYMSIMFEDRILSRKECEMIGVVVSSSNGCEYCVNHHGEALNHYWKDEEKLNSFKKDFRAVELEEKHRVMLEYVEKLTMTPDEVKEEDIMSLRDIGYEDEGILNINLVASYFNFVNRIALGLGVEFTKEEVEGYDY